MLNIENKLWDAIQSKITEQQNESLFKVTLLQNKVTNN